MIPDQISNEEAVRNARLLEKVQDDPMGRILVQNALQACVIEDQTQVIRQLQKELVAKAENGAGSDTTHTPADGATEVAR